MPGSYQISEPAGEYRVAQSSHNELHALLRGRMLCLPKAVGQVESPAFSAWVMVLSAAVPVIAFPGLLNYCTDED